MSLDIVSAQAREKLVMLADSLKIFKTELLQLCPDTGSASDGNDQLWATATTAWTRLEKLKEDLGRGRGGRMGF